MLRRALRRNCGACGWCVLLRRSAATACGNLVAGKRKAGCGGQRLRRGAGEALCCGGEVAIRRAAEDEDSSRESFECTIAQRANQRAPRGGLQLKQCYEGRRVHGVRPRGAMVGSGEGAGRECATTGVVGRCRNTGGRVGTGETKRNEGRGTYYLVSRYM